MSTLPTEPLVMSGLELRSELQELFPAASIITLDATYNLPTRRQVERVFLPELRRILFRLGAEDWDPRFDCEDVAVEGWALAKRKHWAGKQAGTAVAQGIACGLMCYQIDGSLQRGHAIMPFRTGAGWQGFDFRAGGFIPLSDADRDFTWLTLI